MASEQQIKEIDINALEQNNRSVSRFKLRKAMLALGIIILCAGGAYGALKLLAGDLVASRFTVNNMYCPACVVTVSEITEKIPGVEDTSVSLAAQAVTIRFRRNKVSPEDIQKAIASSGYPIQLDGSFTDAGQGVSGSVLAMVNGKPVFARDLRYTHIALDSSKKTEDPVPAFFSEVGRRILLQEADKKTIVVQSSEIDERLQQIGKEAGVTGEALSERLVQSCGSMEKCRQIAAQNIAIERLLQDYIVDGAGDPDVRRRKISQWLAGVFNRAQVRLVDENMKEQMQAAAGQAEWERFWPHMIGENTVFRRLLSL